MSRIVKLRVAAVALVVLFGNAWNHAPSEYQGMTLWVATWTAMEVALMLFIASLREE